MVAVTSSPLTSVRRRMRDLQRRYAPDEDRPLQGYLRALALYAAMTSSLGAVVARRGGPPPEPLPRDLVLGGVATFRASRLLTEANVTSPLRAPFARYEGPGAPAEAREEVQEPHGGARHALGEFVTCPYCAGVWIATIMGFGLVLAPRWTRMAASILAIDAGSDVLQKLYSDLQAR